MELKETIKRLYKPFLILFCLGLVIANWSDICLVSNYKFVYGHLYAFAQEKGIIRGLKGEDYLNQNNFLSIIKLGLKAPIIFTQSRDPKDFDKALKQGVLHYPGSALPGQKEGTSIILGHSAPAGWPKINYEWAFSKLNELNPGDKFSIYFAEQKYFYRVTEKLFLAQGEELPTLTNTKSSVMLVSCWPPGKNDQRIAVRAILR